MRTCDPSVLNTTTPRFSSRTSRDSFDALSKPSATSTNFISSNSDKMTSRELSGKPSLSKLSSGRTLSRTDQKCAEQESNPRVPSGENQLHSSAAAPRQSEAFKRLGQASLVSSSIFKSAPSTPNQPPRSATSNKPSPITQTGLQSTPGSRVSYTPHRAPGSQSQMAAALQGLGIASQTSTATDPRRPLPNTRPLATSTHKPGTKRKSDENLPIPPRPPPNLPPSAPPLQVINQMNPKARPPRQSTAFNVLTRNALVTSSPFKASSPDPSINKSTSSSPETLDRSSSVSPSTSFAPPSEYDAASSHQPDPAPGTPPRNARPELPVPPTSPRSCGGTNGVLKIQRLGGPRGFTPPHATQSSGYASEPEDRRVPSALSCPSRRRERRKTVTWGGEDVLEFEWEEEWRRTSNTSSSDSASQASDLKPEDSSDLSSELDASDPSHPLHPSPEQPSLPSELWKGPENNLECNYVSTHQDSDQHDQPNYEEEDDDLARDRSEGSVIIHEDSEDLQPLAITTNDISLTANSQSSEIDPVDQMVDELLTSPDLAGLVQAQAAQPWPSTSPTHEQERNEPVRNDDSPEEEVSAPTEESQEVGQVQNDDLPGNGHAKRRSRFPYIRTDQPDQSPEQPHLTVASEASPCDPIPSEQTSSAQPASFQPISLSSLGLEDSLFGEASMISSVLESSTLEVEGLDNVSLAPSQPMLSSTPRTSYTNQLPPPNPTTPPTSHLSSAPQEHVEDPPSAHTSPRRPLPRPPSASPGAQTAHTALQALSAAPTSAYNLPDVPQSSPFPSSNQLSGPATAAWVRPAGEGMNSESDTGCDSGPTSPSGTRPRITRKKIHDRIRDRDRGSRAGDESEDVSMSLLSREATSHSASIHKLGLNGEEEKLDLSQEITVESDERSRSTVIPGPVKEIQARPPMRAQQVQLTSDEDALGIQAAQLEPGNLSTISGLDKLARGFQATEDGTKSCDSSISLSKPHHSDVAEPALLPSKMVMIRGAGRRRRSASTGGADLEETGTGAGAKAAVKSTPVKRYSVAVDKENSKITSALLHNTIQPAMSKIHLQEPLNQVLNKANITRTYRVSESDEIVVASDHTMTAGVAGDVATNRNWRKLRKVSDINQHAAQLEAFWAQNDNVNKIGRVFIKMSKLAFRGLPLSQKPVYFQVVIDNGLHKVKTPFYKLEPEVSIGVEFELVRAKKLEFSLAFSVPLNEPRNAHLQPPPPPQPASPPRPVPQVIPQSIPQSPKRLFGFFGASSKRSAKHQQQVRQEQQQQLQILERQRAALDRQLHARPVPHPLVGLLDRNHVLATAIVNFEQYAHGCLGKWKQAVVPCMSALEDPVKAEMQMRRTFTGPIGEVSLEFLSLPPIPKLPNATIPNSGSECLKGLKIAEWWQEVWHEGVLSQLGADCQTWRRRTFKATGGSLFAYNDIMKKLSAEIRLTEVVSLQDCGSADGNENEEPRHSTINDQGEILPPFTFRLVFKDGSEILFHADNQTEFKRWKNVLRQLLGKIQPLPAWAELLRLQIAARQASMADDESDEVEGADGYRQCTKPVGNRQPGRRPRSPKSRAMISKPPSSSSIASSVSTFTSAASSSHPTNLSEITSNTYASFRPASTLMTSQAPSQASSQAPSHRLKLSAITSDTSSCHRPTSTVLTSSSRPTLSAMSSTGSTASSVLSRPTFSTASTSNNPPYSGPTQSQMKRSKGPVRLI
ncbi:hypothetical protein MJO29_005180 [Puccinia striiformis f. sp. tritici]|nr:hypothetical protein Pst134EB_010368 [Puccinia striiformis f. sp. tritici]KAI7960112.1 hypothetical protein MJO29_005180 [Puccinia striiformis f. sp. tritici]